MCFIVLAAAGGGCADEPVLVRSELKIDGSGWYRLDTELWVPRSAICFSQTTKATTYTLDGVPLHDGDCGAFSDELSASRTLTIDVHHGSETAQMVVADMFPGLAATITEPAGGKVGPDGVLLVEVPTALRAFGYPYNAMFEYLDSDGSGYTGETKTPARVDPGHAEVPAPEHPGHFTLRLEMMLNSTDQPIPGRVVSCTGLAKCTARAAANLGPLAVEVAAP